MKKILSVILVLVLVFSLAACGDGAGSGGESDAAKYPGSRVITQIINFGAGGGTDICGRALAEAVAKELGATITITNVSGGSGTVGLAELQKADADGYTIGVGTLASLAVVPSQIEVTFTPDDFEYICAWAQYGYGIVTKAGGKYQTIEDVIEAGKQGTVKFGATADYPQPIPMEVLGELTGADFEYVYYPSTTDMVTDILGGFIDVAVGDEASVNSYVVSGEMTLLAGAADERWINMPDVPTLEEMGYEGAAVISYIGMVAPKEIDKDILEILRASFAVAVEDEKFQEVMKNAGQHSVYMTGPEFEEMIKETYNDYKERLGK